jgi:hypothetical protein
MAELLPEVRIIVQLKDRIRELEAFVEDISGGDCHNYTKHLSDGPCGKCITCRARALTAVDRRNEP